jgi:N-acyl-L-homoserine lactone synthetase
MDIAHLQSPFLLLLHRKHPPGQPPVPETSRYGCLQSRHDHVDGIRLDKLYEIRQVGYLHHLK